MKIAILSDIHANTLALDAVLADIQAQGGVDETWVLGDLVALGPDPVGVLERLAGLPNCHFIRGNTDRYVTTGDRPGPYLTDPDLDSAKILRMVEIAGTFAWTQGAVAVTGWWDWMAQLPLELERTLPDGTRCLCVHAAPGSDDGDGIAPDTADETIAGLLDGCPADLVCVGHTHQPFDRRVGRWRIMNPGSISNPSPPETQAVYALLQADASGYHIEHRKAAYDREAVAGRVEELRHPGAKFIFRYMRPARS